MWFRIYALDKYGNEIERFDAGYTPKGIVNDDDEAYLGDPACQSSALKITKSSYDKLKDFANKENGFATTEKFGNTDYEVFTNSCVDYVWKALNIAGYNEYDFEGKLVPMSNCKALQTIQNKTDNVAPLIFNNINLMQYSFYNNMPLYFLFDFNVNNANKSTQDSNNLDNLSQPSPNPHPPTNNTTFPFKLIIKDYDLLTPLKNKEIQITNIDSKQCYESKITTANGEVIFEIPHNERGDFFSVELINDDDYEINPYYLAKESNNVYIQSPHSQEPNQDFNQESNNVDSSNFNNSNSPNYSNNPSNSNSLNSSSSPSNSSNFNDLDNFDDASNSNDSSNTDILDNSNNSSNSSNFNDLGHSRYSNILNNSNNLDNFNDSSNFNNSNSPNYSNNSNNPSNLNNSNSFSDSNNQKHYNNPHSAHLAHTTNTKSIYQSKNTTNKILTPNNYQKYPATLYFKAKIYLYFNGFTLSVIQGNKEIASYEARSGTPLREATQPSKKQIAISYINISHSNKDNHNSQTNHNAQTNQHSQTNHSSQTNNDSQIAYFYYDKEHCDKEHGAIKEGTYFINIHNIIKNISPIESKESNYPFSIGRRWGNYNMAIYTDEQCNSQGTKPYFLYQVYNGEFGSAGSIGVIDKEIFERLLFLKECENGIIMLKVAYLNVIKGSIRFIQET